MNSLETQAKVQRRQKYNEKVQKKKATEYRKASGGQCGDTKRHSERMQDAQAGEQEGAFH